MALVLNHVILVWFVPSVYPKSETSTPLHCNYGVRIHPYHHPLHGKLFKHFIYALDESLIQSGVALVLNHVILVWFVLSVYPKSESFCPLHCYYGVRIHSYDHPQHRKVLKHLMYTLDESLNQSGVSIVLNHVILVWFVSSVYPKSATYTPLLCYYGVRIHPYHHPLDGKLVKHFIYALDESFFQSGVALVLNHVILVWFVPSVYPQSEIFIYLHCNYGVRIHSYVHPQHGKVLKHFIYTLDEKLIQSVVALVLNHVILEWFVPSVYPKSATSTPLH